jgi:hypothetical protein
MCIQYDRRYVRLILMIQNENFRKKNCLTSACFFLQINNKNHTKAGCISILKRMTNIPKYTSSYSSIPMMIREIGDAPIVQANTSANVSVANHAASCCFTSIKFTSICISLAIVLSNVSFLSCRH